MCINYVKNAINCMWELHEISINEPNSLDFCMEIHVVSKLNKFHKWNIT